MQFHAELVRVFAPWNNDSTFDILTMQWREYPNDIWGKFPFASTRIYRAYEALVFLATLRGGWGICHENLGTYGKFGQWSGINELLRIHAWHSLTAWAEDCLRKFRTDLAADRANNWSDSKERNLMDILTRHPDLDSSCQEKRIRFDLLLEQI